MLSLGCEKRALIASRSFYLHGLFIQWQEQEDCTAEAYLINDFMFCEVGDARKSVLVYLN